MSLEAKYASPNIRKSNNRGKNISGKSQELDRNVFGIFMASQNESKLGKNKIVAMECESDDNEILINKRVRKRIVGNVKDDRTGSMMPVVLEQMVDGTKSKKTGRKVSHMSSMSKRIQSVLELELKLKTQMESSEDDLDSNLDKHRVLLVQNVSEKKKVDVVAKKLQKANRKEIPNKKEVRSEQKENDIPMVAKGVPTPKGKPGKSVHILDEQI